MVNERKRSFIIIEIMETLSPEQMINNAIIFINKQETMLRYISNMNYYFMSLILSFINMVIYYKSYEISNVIIKQDDESRLLNKTQLTSNKLLIYDNGIKLYNFFIPYESILQFGNMDERIYFTIFGNIEFGEKIIKITLDKSKVYISFKAKNNKCSEFINNAIKWNMYYHIKYHKIDKRLIENYV